MKTEHAKVTVAGYLVRCGGCARELGEGTNPEQAELKAAANQAWELRPCMPFAARTNEGIEARERSSVPLCAACARAVQLFLERSLGGAK